MLRQFGLLALAWGLLLHPAALSSAARQQSAPQRCFVETGHCIQGRFLEVWSTPLNFTTDPAVGTVNPWGGDSGLTRHGYPLTDEVTARLADGQAYTVQYFERTRLEYHPENAPPYDVLIGAVGRDVHPADAPVAALPAHGNERWEPVYFSETGHNLRGFFRVYWTLHGGLAQFGYPLTEEYVATLDDGHAYLVQYFERARFEYHMEIPAPNGVVLGQLGRIVYQGRH